MNDTRKRLSEQGGEMEGSGSKAALVTGGGDGIGRMLAEALGGEGLRVAVNDINPDRAAETARRIEASGGEALVHIADISKKFPVQAMFNAAEDAWGRLDVVVNCSQVLPARGVLDMDEWDWRRTLDVNLTGAFLLTQVAGRVMRSSGGGLVVHIVRPPNDAGQAAAVEAARTGLFGFVRASAAELSEAGVHLAVLDMGPDAAGEVVANVMKMVLNLA